MVLNLKANRKGAVFMLGTSAEIIQYKTINDFNSAKDYLEYMFNGIQGIVYRATIAPQYFQNYYRSSGIIKAKYEGVKNCYISMNSYFRDKSLDKQHGRDLDHLKRLSAFYVDIDCYKKGLTKGEVLDRLNYEYIGSKIPEPTFTIDSGRGIYLVWKLRNQDRNALPRWTAVQNYLVDTLEPLGADPACKDATRILRVPYTINSKSNSVVSILEFNDLTYSIYDIAKEYEINQKQKSKIYSNVKKYPYGQATENQRKYVRDIARKLELSEKDYPNFENYKETDRWIKLHKNIPVTHREDDRNHKIGEFKSIKGVLGAYCNDIRTLLTMRKGEDCKRELALFLYRYFRREMGYDSETALKETLEFNASLDCPFDNDYVVAVTKSADRRIDTGIPYAYSKATIIKLLDITKEELSQLPFLAKASRNKKERRKEQNRQAYAKKLSAEGKSTKKDSILNRRASIYAMQQQGKTASEIQKELKISRATYHRDIAALNIASVLADIKSILAEKTKQIKNTAKKAAKAVSTTLKTAKKSSFFASIRNAIKATKTTLCSMSHFFSCLFIDSTAKLYRTPPWAMYMATKLRITRYIQKHTGDNTDDDGDTDSS